MFARELDEETARHAAMAGNKSMLSKVTSRQKATEENFTQKLMKTARLSDIEVDELNLDESVKMKSGGKRTNSSPLENVQKHQDRKLTPTPTLPRASCLDQFSPPDDDNDFVMTDDSKMSIASDISNKQNRSKVKRKTKNKKTR